MPEHTERQRAHIRRDAAPGSQRQRFQEAPGETEADAMRDAYLASAGSERGDSTPLLTNSDPATQIQLVHRMQREHGNAYVQRALAGTRGLPGRLVGLSQPEMVDEVQRRKGDGSPLPGETRARMEGFFGADLRRVRVHVDDEAAALSSELDAAAFTVGNDVFFAAGQYNPASAKGQGLLAHELTHTQQQAAPGAGLVAASPVLQRQAVTPDPGATADATQAPPVEAEASLQDIMDNYEADAFVYFETNMRAQLMNGAAIEGASIGLRAAGTAAELVAATLKPYEDDQETDTLALNTLFNVAAGSSSGASAVAGSGAPASANIAMSAVNAGLSVVQTWLPSLAGYSKVGDLKAAAQRKVDAAAKGGGETSSPAFKAYENDVMQAMSTAWANEIADTKIAMLRDPSLAAGAAGLQRTVFWPVAATRYLGTLRATYGAQSPVGDAMADAIRATLQPTMDELRRQLDAAKEHRKTVQAWAALGTGVATGAAIGAVLGGGLPGAAAGAVIGGLIGGGTALWIKYR